MILNLSSIFSFRWLVPHTTYDHSCIDLSSCSRTHPLKAHNHSSYCHWTPPKTDIHLNSEMCQIHLFSLLSSIPYTSSLLSYIRCDYQTSNTLHTHEGHHFPNCPYIFHDEKPSSLFLFHSSCPISTLLRTNFPINISFSHIRSLDRLTTHHQMMIRFHRWLFLCPIFYF